MANTWDIIGLAVKFLPYFQGQGTEAPEAEISTKDMALLSVRQKPGSVTVIVGTRDTGKSTMAYRYCEFLGRKTYAVSPEERPPSWVERIKLEEVFDCVKPHSTLVCDDLPAYASNRDYNNNLIAALEKMIPMVRHERELHLVFCTQSSAQADKYILDCDMAFFKPLGLLFEDLERPGITKLYKKYVNPEFDGRSENWIKRHAYMFSRTYKGLITVSKPAYTKSTAVIDGVTVETEIL